MKRSYITILVLFISFLGYTAQVTAQNFTDTLGIVYLTQESQASIINISYDQLNIDLIDMTDINFSREIRVAKKDKTTLSINKQLNISKSSYLKALRAAANSTENIDDFYKKVYGKIPALENATTDEAVLSKLYITVKKNSLHGKMDAIGSELSWL